MSQMPGVVATIDWTNQTITFGMQKVRTTETGSPNAAPAAARWEVRASDLTLRQSLMRWAKDAGWQVSWEAKYDFPVQLEAAFGGTFENAVEQLTASLRTSEFPLLGCMYEGNRVVRVLHYGDKKECEKVNINPTARRIFAASPLFLAACGTLQQERR
ncbi:toxin co-regulated pilus biosynthesis Q family protein [Cupriavidus basilensis]